MMKKLGIYSDEYVKTLSSQDGMECVNCEEGCLIDNLLFYDTITERYFMCVERYLNEWSSCYEVFTGDAEVEDKWYDMFYYYTTSLENNDYIVILKVVKEKYNLNPVDLEHLTKTILATEKWNWFNFEVDMPLYDADGVECAKCTKVDNVNKVITFTQD